MPFSIHEDGDHLTVTFEGTLSDDEFAAYLDQYGARLIRHARYALTIDARNAGVPNSHQRRLQANWMKRHQADVGQRCVGIAFVITNQLVRGALTAILWLQPLPAPSEVVADVETARRWCHKRLEAAR